MPLETQSVYAMASQQWSLASLKKWILAHGMTPIKPGRIYGGEIRFRITEPSQYSHFVTKTLPDGVHIVLGERKK